MKRLRELEKENERLQEGRIGPHPREADPEGGRLGKLSSPARRRACDDRAGEVLSLKALRLPRKRPDEDALTADIVALASQYGRYGYRRITAMLREAGWVVNLKRVERIWRRD